MSFVTYCMARLIVLNVILFLFSCSTAPLPRQDYYGALNIEGYTVRLVFSNTGVKPSLRVVGMRVNEIAINKVSFENDTLRFSRSDIFTNYKGYYDPDTGNITGQWTGDDSITFPLTFVPVLADTICEGV